MSGPLLFPPSFGSSGLFFGCNRGLERLLLFGREIGRLVLVENRHQPDLVFAIEPVIDHAQSAAPALAAASIGPADFSKASGAGHHLAECWIVGEQLLHRAKLFVV